jgi:hypothetical protein
VVTPVDWQALFERERARVEDGEARLDPEQLVRIGNAAYGAGLALLMLGRDDEGREWLARAAARWRESWEHATPTSWGRPIGTIKASLIGGRRREARAYARWALELGCETAESPIGRYAAALALLTLARWPDARHVAATLRDRDDFPRDVADALWSVAANDPAGYAAAAGSIVRSFETREEFLEDVPVADTALALQALASRRGVATDLGRSPVLPRAGGP